MITNGVDRKTSCRKCKRPLRPEERVFYDGNNRPTKTPVCQLCYEDLVRHAGRRGLGVTPAQNSPGYQDRKYHGGMFHRGEW
jgi:hypothetical protein